MLAARVYGVACVIPAGDSLSRMRWPLLSRGRAAFRVYLFLFTFSLSARIMSSLSLLCLLAGLLFAHVLAFVPAVAAAAALCARGFSKCTRAEKFDTCVSCLCVAWVRKNENEERADLVK